jgi:hypothetical protein
VSNELARSIAVSLLSYAHFRDCETETARNKVLDAAEYTVGLKLSKLQEECADWREKALDAQRELKTLKALCDRIANFDPLKP